MIRYAFILILLANSAMASDLDDRLMKHLCNGSAQRRKVEVSWVAKPDSQAGQRLDIAQEKIAEQQKQIRAAANSKFASVSDRYYPEKIEDFVKGGPLDETNLSTYLANQFILMIPQKLHADEYAEECLPQYGENQFLGYRNGKPVMSALDQNKVAIWGCYALKHTTVLDSEGMFTARLDLGAFCKYARPADSFLAK